MGLLADLIIRLSLGMVRRRSNTMAGVVPSCVSERIIIEAACVYSSPEPMAQAVGKHGFQPY
jgi:hypothetical protein